jgi:hypothetical protein
MNGWNALEEKSRSEVDGATKRVTESADNKVQVGSIFLALVEESSSKTLTSNADDVEGSSSSSSSDQSSSSSSDEECG